MSFFFFHNTDTCIGCCACQVACKDRNNLLPGEFFRRVVELRISGDSRPHFYSGSCCHCREPACISACPNGAFYKAEDGTVLHDDSKCIGCGKCVWSCPFGEISLSREHGVAQKCDGCMDRREKGLEPACVGACVNGSLCFRTTDGRVSGEDDTAKLGGAFAGETGPQVRIHWAGVTSGGE